MTVEPGTRFDIHSNLGSLTNFLAFFGKKAVDLMRVVSSQEFADFLQNCLSKKQIRPIGKKQFSNIRDLPMATKTSKYKYNLNVLKSKNLHDSKIIRTVMVHKF